MWTKYSYINVKKHVIHFLSNYTPGIKKSYWKTFSNDLFLHICLMKKAKGNKYTNLLEKNVTGFDRLVP